MWPIARKFQEWLNSQNRLIDCSDLHKCMGYSGQPRFESTSLCLNSWFSFVCTCFKFLNFLQCGLASLKNSLFSRITMTLQSAIGFYRVDYCRFES